MSEIAQAVTKLAGDSPSSIWSRSGQLSFVLGSASVVGLSFGDVGFGHAEGYAPLLLVVTGAFAMWYGGQKRKALSAELHQQALELAREAIGGIFPRSRGVDAFILEMLNEPQSREELANADTFSEFQGLTIDQLSGLLHQSYAERGQLRGGVVYDHEIGKFVATDKAHNDQTVINK